MGEIILGHYVKNAEAQLPQSFLGESGGNLREEDDSVSGLTQSVDTDRTPANGSTAFLHNLNEDR